MATPTRTSNDTCGNMHREPPRPGWSWRRCDDNRRPRHWRCCRGSTRRSRIIAGRRPDDRRGRNDAAARSMPPPLPVRPRRSGCSMKPCNGSRRPRRLLSRGRRRCRSIGRRWPSCVRWKWRCRAGRRRSGSGRRLRRPQRVAAKRVAADRAASGRVKTAVRLSPKPRPGLLLLGTPGAE